MSSKNLVRYTTPPEGASVEGRRPNLLGSKVAWSGFRRDGREKLKDLFVFLTGGRGFTAGGRGFAAGGEGRLKN